MQCSPLGKALDKAAYTNGYAKNSLLAALVKLGSMIGHCYLTVWMVVSGHVKENQEISFTKGGTESGWPFIRFKLANYVAQGCL